MQFVRSLLFSFVFLSKLVAYCDAFELPHNIVAMAGHKTGTELSLCLLGALKDNYFKNATLYRKMLDAKGHEYDAQYSFYHSNGNLPFPGDWLNEYRYIFFIRHPLDRFISSVNYHRISSESWLGTKNVFELENKDVINGVTEETSYQDYIRNLTDSDAFLFSINSLSRLYNEDWRIPWRWNTEWGERIPIERSRTDWEGTLREILKVWLGSDAIPRHAIDRLINLSIFDKCNYVEQAKTGKYSTVNETEAKILTQSTYNFVGRLTCRELVYFERYSGVEAMNALGYTDSVYASEREKVCGGDEAHKTYTYPEFPKYLK